MVLKHVYVLVGAVSQKMLRRPFKHYVYVLKGQAGNLNKAIGGPPQQVTSYIFTGHKLETLFSYNLELCTEQVPSTLFSSNFASTDNLLSSERASESATVPSPFM